MFGLDFGIILSRLIFLVSVAFTVTTTRSQDRRLFYGLRTALEAEGSPRFLACRAFFCHHNESERDWRTFFFRIVMWMHQCYVPCDYL